MSTVASAADFPESGEGPNENALALLADGVTLTCIYRMDNGDGNPNHPELAKNSPFYQGFSHDGGKTWSKGVPMPGTVKAIFPARSCTDWL
jgi:hypothetical protein